MGIFSKSNKHSSENNGATIIPYGTHLIGGIDTKGSIHIDGKFEGVIASASYITIGKTGEFYGKIESKSVTVSGFIDGNIDCEQMHILSTGKVIGELSYESLTIDPDGIFDGKGKRKNLNVTSRYEEVKKRIQGGFLSQK
jgi:cytoskeletal protein CcmA (bactofilin family)